MESSKTELVKGSNMNDLLKLAVEAHGGLDRWNQLKTLTANISVTGALWHLKGKPDILKGNRGTLFTVQKALPVLNDGASIILTGSVAGSKRYSGFQCLRRYQGGATLLCAKLDHGA